MPGGQLVAQPGQVHAAGAAQRDGELGAVEDRPHGRADAPRSAQRRWPARRAARRPPPRRGRTARAAPGWPPRRRGRRRSRRASRSASSSVSLTGISSGAATITTPVCAGSPRMSSIHPVWSRTMPDLHQLLDRLRRRQLAGDVAGGRRVDDHEVVAALAHLPQELADGEDLLHPRRRVGHEVERAGQRAEPGDERDLQLEAQVLLERLLGVHRHREQARATPRAP